jgi:hypothetical protein
VSRFSFLPFLFFPSFLIKSHVPAPHSHRHRGALLEVRVLVGFSCSYFGLLVTLRAVKPLRNVRGVEIKFCCSSVLKAS